MVIRLYTSTYLIRLQEHSDKWVPWIPHEMYMKAFANALRVPYFIFKYGPALLGQGNYFFSMTMNNIG